MNGPTKESLIEHYNYFFTHTGEPTAAAILASACGSQPGEQLIDDKLYTKKEACQWLAISERTLDRHVREGRLTTCTMGTGQGAIRFLGRELRRFRDESTSNPFGPVDHEKIDRALNLTPSTN